jgi:hypothetical protein
MTDSPIACTLAPDDYAARIESLSALADSLLSREPIPGGARLIFGDEVERELEAAIAAEAACCPFLTMTLERTQAGLTLDVTGPAEAEPIIAELFA